MKFSKGDKFKANSKIYTIEDILGSGGQGEVYLVKCENNYYAFKYFIDKPERNFINNLMNNINKGAPSDNFIWPKELIEFKNSFGYIMDLRPKEYSSFVSYLTGKTKLPSMKILLNWCIELVKSFKHLHEKGLSYQDLNEGSFFIKKETGELLICDNDNVAAAGQNFGILGKMRYMAPEIVRGDIDPFTNDRQMPDIHSDRFSLAIILFLALCLGNPFEGNRLKGYDIIDEKAEFELFGSNPIYIYNKDDSSNRPIRGYHASLLKRYPLLPSYIKEAFHRTFVDGLKDRENGRTTEIEWIRLLCKYRDELVTCKCGLEYIYGFEEKTINNTCPLCGEKVRDFCYLIVGKHKIILEPKKFIYKFHLNKYSSDYNTPICEVIVNKNNKELWGIKLDLEEDVYIKDSKDNEKTIPANGVVPIISNLKLKFNDNVIGQIITNK